MQKNINKYFRRAVLNFKKEKKKLKEIKDEKQLEKEKKLYTASRSKRNPKDGWPKGGVSR